VKEGSRENRKRRRNCELRLLDQEVTEFRLSLLSFIDKDCKAASSFSLSYLTFFNPGQVLQRLGKASRRIVSPGLSFSLSLQIKKK